MKVHLHIMVLRNPQAGSSVRSSICFSVTNDDGQDVAALYLEGMENASCLIPEGHYSGRVDSSVIWNSPIIRIDAHDVTLSIFHRCSSTKSGIGPIYIGLCSTTSDSISDNDKALYLIEALLKSYEVESVDLDVCNE